MPTYDYKCLECGTQFELFQNMTEDPIQECPDCNGKVKRLIGAGAGLIFRGSGFYTTDYRGDSYKEAAKKDKAPSSGDSKESKSGDKKSGGDKKSSGDTKPSGDTKSDGGKDTKSSDSKSSKKAASSDA